MKLYVWRHVLTDYTSGIAVAAAETMEQARTVLVNAAEGYAKEALAGDISGEPDDIYDLPAGAFCWGGG